jgi:hypothetical protein
MRPHGCVHLKRIKKFSNFKKNETTWMCSPKENQDFEETSLAKLLVWVVYNIEPNTALKPEPTNLVNLPTINPKNQ